MKKKVKLSLNKKTISNLEHIFGGTGETSFDDLSKSVYIGPCPNPPNHTITCRTCPDQGLTCPYISLRGC